MKDHMRERERERGDVKSYDLQDSYRTCMNLYDLFALQPFQPRPGRVHC